MPCSMHCNANEFKGVIMKVKACNEDFLLSLP